MISRTTILLLGVFIQVVFGDFEQRCTESNKTVSFEPVKDLEGRFIVEYCFPYNSKYTTWEISLNFFNVSKTKCNDFMRLRRNLKHSFTIINLNLGELNCIARVCLSKPLDLVFNGCYRLDNKLSTLHNSGEPSQRIIYVDNNITGPSHYYQSRVLARDFSPEGNNIVSFYWYSEKVPIGDYDVSLCKTDNNATHCKDPWSDVTSNCSLQSELVSRCEFHTSPGQCYNLHLKQNTPWASGFFFRNLSLKASNFCHEWSPAARASTHSVWWWGWGWWGPLAGLLLVVSVSGCVRHGKFLLNLKEHKYRILDSWKKQTRAKLVVPGEPASDSRDCPVFLLRAEENNIFAEQFFHTLTELLNANGHSVLDLHMAGAAALLSESPLLGAGRLLGSPAVRVLLLLTPPLRGLLLPGGGGEPASPPAPSSHSTRVLQYCLASLPALSTPASPYHKFYVASLPTEQNTGVLDHVVPFKRYVLPATVKELLADLRRQPDQAGPPDHMELLDQSVQPGQTDLSELSELQEKYEAFQTAARNYVEYIRNSQSE